MLFGHLTDALKELATIYEKDNLDVKFVFHFGSSVALQQAIALPKPKFNVLHSAMQAMTTLMRRHR